MTPVLLDASVLIPLVVAEHEHHNRVAEWARDVSDVALCPITEGALVRFLVRSGESAAMATDVLRALHDSPRVEFWPDDVSYSTLALRDVLGHRQVADSYLANLAARRGARIATCDRGLAGEHPDVALLIP